MQKSCTLIAERIGCSSPVVTVVSETGLQKVLQFACGKERWLVKLQSNEGRDGLLEQEAAGLLALQANSLFTIPAVIATGVAAGSRYMALQWLQQVPFTPQGWVNCGEWLARLHQCTAPAFGWQQHNFIGQLPQYNTWHTDGALFWATQRIAPLVQQLALQLADSAGLLHLLDQFILRLPHLLPPEAPALVHGDLWNGNLFATGDGSEVALFDPAIHYGYREADLAMTRLFGGFPRLFYEAYAAVFPLESGWKERVRLFQLYPLLVHALLFGGHYTSEAVALLRCLATASGGALKHH